MVFCEVKPEWWRTMLGILGRKFGFIPRTLKTHGRL